MDETNGHSKEKTIFGVPCKGCSDRAEIMGAGNWKVDALILLSVTVLISGILILKYVNLGD